jgi:hypothetical protein
MMICHFAHYSFFSSIDAGDAGHFANAMTHRSTKIPPGINAMNANAGLKPTRAQILQNGTTKRIADAIIQGRISDSSI